MSFRVRVLVYALLVGGIAAYLSQPYRVGLVVGESMAPALHHGTPYLMRRLGPGEEVSRGDVVVFRRNGRSYVKRVLGLPGDRFYVAPRAGSVSVDILIHADLLAKYRAVRARLPHSRIALRRVPAGTLYVLGDNMEKSEDSRAFGFVEIESIQGLVEEAPETSRTQLSDVARPAFHAFPAFHGV